MALPGNYQHIVYKFRAHQIQSENEFLQIKSSGRNDYLKRIKNRIQKEKKIYRRHHRISMMTFFTSVIVCLCVIFLYGISNILDANFLIKENPFKVILLFVTTISIIALITLQYYRFPSSYFSFKKYLNEKIKYHNSLKTRIDNCKDFNNYRDKFPG